MDQQLIDRIYECSFAPELWPGVLDELAQIVDGWGGAFVIANANVGVVGWTASTEVYEDAATYVSEGWIMRGSRLNRLFGARHAGFLSEYDLFTAEELDSDPVYRDFFRPRSFGWQATTGVPLPTGDWFIFSVGRHNSRGPVEPAFIQQLDVLRPHLARSALMSARLRLERARAATETLALIGLPALVFDNQGKVIAANHLIEAITEHVQWRAQNRVSLKDTNANALFRQAVETLNIINGTPVRSFAVRGADTNAAMVAHVIPIRRSARDIFVRCAGVLVMTPLTLPQAPPVELVQSLFDLTPAEARVARSLSAGETVEKIASIGGVSLNTVRTQVRGVLEKTGCRRQAEVVALLGGVRLSAFDRGAT
ncbi:helix-turn-helix transcriptional regulator [Beijerinckiaceae bacterium]|nr:helix-turn-helix transcriptional regulator [Beijerinckiaceae bacterium]